MEGIGVSQMADRKAPRSNDPPSETWRKLPWRKLEQYAYRIQKRIYRASQHGNVRAVQKLQKLLMKSEAARLIAVRRVTQDNQGKKTAGIDGIKSVTPKQRLTMVNQLYPKYWKRRKAKPVRRVWIPKPGKTEKRPLGIPVMLDRAQQALVKMALEPEWEAQFEPNSYGFRPGRSCHDAIGAIFSVIRYKPKFVLDADIKGCFDNINHQALLRKLHTTPVLRQTIKGWLKAGVVDKEVFTPTAAGTPQGGVISPLLANIALHGMEQACVKGVKKPKEQPFLIRYADDYVILHSDREILEQAAKRVKEWLDDMGLHLSPQKTKITHTLTPVDGQVGFDFLGFTVRQFQVGKTHTGRDTTGKPLGFKTIIKPSKEAIIRHTKEVKQRIKELRPNSQAELIGALNPIIRGWSAYYSTVVSSVVFTKCDDVLYHQLIRWINRRHPQKGSRWKRNKYWRIKENRHWVFATPEGAEIRKHEWSHIRRHIKVRGNASPYDGNLLYWTQRLKTHPMLNGTLAKLLQQQRGKCGWCRLMFKDGDLIEIDHVDRNRGNNVLSNLWALHRHCHDSRHANDETGTIDK
jgi:RNA-directed DNA polymerase